MSSDHDELLRLNVEIGGAEARGDAAFFEKLLASAFAMRRADGKRIDDRERFIASVSKSTDRPTVVHSITFFERNRALVSCTVTMETPEGDQTVGSAAMAKLTFATSPNRDDASYSKTIEMGAGSSN